MGHQPVKVEIPLPPPTDPPVSVSVWFPAQITRPQWSHLMAVLIAMRPGLVVEPEDAAQAAGHNGPHQYE